MKKSKIETIQTKISKLQVQQQEIDKEIELLEQKMKEELFTLHKKLASKKKLTLAEFAHLLEDDANQTNQLEEYNQ